MVGDRIGPGEYADRFAMEGFGIGKKHAPFR